MSNSPEGSGFSSRRVAISPEKPRSFSRTWRMLRSYLKANGGLRDLNIDMKCNGGTKGSSLSDSPASRTMDLFPLHPNFCNPPTKENHHVDVNKTVKPESQTAQMTMIYKGKVFVFNSVPSEKAEEIISLAKKEATTQIYTESVNPPATHVAKAQSENINSIANFLNNFSKDCTHASRTLIPCDLPIARKNSVYRFLEKRKDRFVGRAPYGQISDGSMTAALQKPAENKSWLGLASQPLQ